MRRSILDLPFLDGNSPAPDGRELEVPPSGTHSPENPLRGVGRICGITGCCNWVTMDYTVGFGRGAEA